MLRVPQCERDKRKTIKMYNVHFQQFLTQVVLGTAENEPDPKFCVDCGDPLKLIFRSCFFIVPTRARSYSQWQNYGNFFN